jgi:hypothetical protein
MLWRDIVRKGKFRVLNDNSLAFFCKGCNEYHRVPVTGSNAWRFSGDFDSPTLAPSILVTKPGDPAYKCHSFVTDGRIQYLSDCSHVLAGKTIDLEEPIDH